jgi:hypothetical protein
MSLKDKYQTLLTKDVGDVTAETDPIKYIGMYFAGVGSCIIGIAAEIDLLRNELVAKGLLESEQAL